MRKRRADHMLLGVSLSGFLIMSISFLLMPVEAIGSIPGLMFWCGLIIGIVLQIALAIRCRGYFASDKEKRQKIKQHRIGLFAFGSNRLAVIVDVVMVMSIIAAVLALVITEGYGYVCYVFISTATLSFCLHCILNGKIFYYLSKQDRVRRIPNK